MCDNGALFFAPLTEQEAKEANVQLAAHHIVVPHRYSFQLLSW